MWVSIMEKIISQKNLNIFCIIILLGFCGAAFFTFPSYDDFSYSASIVKSGVWQSQIDHYFDWGGRFSSNFIIAVMAFLDPQWNFYGSWSMALILTFFLTHYIFLKKIKLFFDFDLIKTWLTTAAIILTALPSIVQFSYWITGAIYYSVGIFATAAAIPLLISRELNAKSWKNIFLVLLTAIIVGNNELSLIGWQELLLTFTILKFLKYKRWDNFLIFLILFGSGLGLFSLLAPGNFVRQAEFEKSGQVFRTLSNGVLHYFLFSIKLLSPALVVLIIKFRKNLISIVDRLLSGIPQRLAQKIIFWHWFLFLFSTSALAFWAMGRKPNTRSLNVIMYYYWLMIPFIVWLLKDIQIPTLLKNISLKIEKFWIPLTVISLLLSINVRNLMNDYLFNFSTYRQEWTQNMDALKNGKGKDVILIAPTIKAETTFFSDFLPKRDVKYFKKIYGVKSVKVIDKEENK